MRSALLMLMLLICARSAWAQHTFSRHYYLNDAEIPVKANTITQDDNGYIWIGTDNGIYRFNGRQVVLIAPQKDKPVTALTAYHNTVLAGFADGSVATLDGKELKPFDIQGAKPATAITDIKMDAAGVLWLCTEGEGFFAIVNHLGVACNKTTGLSDDYVYNLSIFPLKRVVVSTDRGINEVYFDNGKLQINNVTTSNGLADNIARVLKPSPDVTDCWVGTQEGGISFYCSNSRKVWTPYIDSAWRWGQINDILPMGKGRAWVATENGYLLELYTPDYDTVYVNAHHFEGRRMKQLLLGRSGVIWCATNTGMTMITDAYMQYLPVPPPYTLRDVRAMACDKDNNLWFSLENKLYKLPLHSKSVVPALQHTAAAGITALHADAKGALWIGTIGDGVWQRSAAGKLSKLTGIPMLEKENVLDISSMGRVLWVSGLNGVAELDISSAQPKLQRVHNKKSGAGSDYVYQVYPDSKGRVWMATDGGGITMLKDGKYTHYGALQGIKSKVAYTVSEDGLGHIWVSALGDGLYWYNESLWRQMGSNNGLQDINIHTIAGNATGQVVVVHDNGIDVWYPYSHQFRSYNSRQGMHIDSSSRILKLYAKDTARNVYIPFEHGFIVFRNIYAPFDIRPDVHIENVSLFFKPVSPDKTKYAYDENHISFAYEGINFANPDKLHYRYKLDGYNDTWVITNDESVTFPQLPAGKYTFTVQSSLNSSFGKYNEASYSFTIRNPFWRTPWFILLFAGVVFGIVYAYITIREKNLRKLATLQRERLMFEYENLKSQVNPHFLFNSLNTLASLIEDDKEAAGQYTTHLSDLYRNMLLHRNKDLVLLSEEMEILDNYLYVQQSRFADALQIHKDIPPAVLASRRIVPLALQLLVENALKHNVVSKSKPLHITITATDDAITIRNSFNPKISKEKGAGMGLANIKKRYALLTDKKMYYGVSEKEFIVNLPLL
ncbi:hypothetical protein CAP35_12840 [Chitinophagaceae bacterium IBVUCB1]|nr:hypothetical protein CAP35_12840 [Chitinophagaceae bacterium IBVUCB1]